jgi:hypothetical protein
MISSRQLVAAIIAVMATLAVGVPVAGASAATTAVPRSAGLWGGGLPVAGETPQGAASCGTANSLGLDAGTGGTETKVCTGAGLTFVGPSIGQIATVMGPTIIGPAVVGVAAVSAGSILIG